MQKLLILIICAFLYTGLSNIYAAEDDNNPAKDLPESTSATNPKDKEEKENKKKKEKLKNKLKERFKKKPDINHESKPATDAATDSEPPTESRRLAQVSFNIQNSTKFRYMITFIPYNTLSVVNNNSKYFFSKKVDNEISQQDDTGLYSIDGVSSYLYFVKLKTAHNIYNGNGKLFIQEPDTNLGKIKFDLKINIIPRLDVPLKANKSIYYYCGENVYSDDNPEFDFFISKTKKGKKEFTYKKQKICTAFKYDSSTRKLLIDISDQKEK